MIRLATTADLDAILAVYAVARRAMANAGNPTQWGNTYPAVELLGQDLALGRLYVEELDGAVHGAFMFAIGDDPTYAYIEDGAWKDPSPYGVIHRVASDGRNPGLLGRCVNFCRNLCNHLRIDTHHDNHRMQHLLPKLGFDRCGIIYVEDGSARIAYEWSN